MFHPQGVFPTPLKKISIIKGSLQHHPYVNNDLLDINLVNLVN
jgi:hypothetical protein